jgi:hypothetical protein
MFVTELEKSGAFPLNAKFSHSGAQRAEKLPFVKVA